jgi:translocation and assembly module TamA
MGAAGRRTGAAWGALVGCAAWPACALAQATPPPAAPVPPPAPPAEPLPPMEPLPGIGVDWPDLGQAPGAETAGEAGAAAAAAAETRYGFRLDGLGAAGTALLHERFDQLSSLKSNAGDPANAAQLDRRAREDADLLTGLLRAEGYYDARVATRVEPGARPLVVLEAEPGALYRFAAVDLPGLDRAGDKAASLRDVFGVEAGDPVDADAVAAAEARLRAAVGAQGFAFARVGEPQVTVDREARTATLALALEPNGARTFGRITANADNRVFDARHVAEIARFTPGEPFNQADVDDLRRALIQTGLVSVADVTPVEGAAPGTVDVAVRLEPAPPRTIAGELGYGTGEGARAEISWTHRNLFPPEGGLTLRGVLGTREQLGSVVFRRNNFRARDRVLTAQVTAAHTRRDAYDARTFTLGASLEKQTNIFFQKLWTWSLGGELAASDERDVILATGQPRRRTFFIAAVPTSLNYDGSDDLLNPTRGFRLGGRLSPELSLQGAAFGYARTQIDASAYHAVVPNVVLAGRVRLGTIVGAPRDAVAPSRRFYAGGGASVRGYGYQSIGPRDTNNDPIGGRSLTEFAAEARVRVFGSFGVVPFVDAGNIYTSPLPKLDGLRFGTGLGLRYYSNFGPIRLDVGTPINPQKGDARIAVYVSLGQAF